MRAYHFAWLGQPLARRLSNAASISGVVLAYFFKGGVQYISNSGPALFDLMSPTSGLVKVEPQIALT